MKTSARNVFKGKVSQIKTGAINDEIVLDIGAGAHITSIITNESTKNLGLKVGADAFALVKASFVILIDSADNVKLSSRNIFPGKVKSVTPGAVNSEVTLEISKDQAIVAIVTNESCKNLGLKAGTTACAIIKASNVIVGVNT